MDFHFNFSGTCSIVKDFNDKLILDDEKIILTPGEYCPDDLKRNFNKNKWKI